MIANIGPADYNYDETMSTLRHELHKQIQNKPKINEDLRMPCCADIGGNPRTEAEANGADEIRSW